MTAPTAGSPARPVATRPDDAGAHSPTSPTTPRRSRAPAGEPPAPHRRPHTLGPGSAVYQLVAADHVPHTLVGANRFRNDPDRRVSNDPAARVGSAVRVGRPTLQRRPGQGTSFVADDLARRVGTTTRGLFLARYAELRIARAPWTTPRCPAGSEPTHHSTATRRPRRRVEPHSNPPPPCAHPDQLPLELGQRHEDAEHEAAGRGRGVDLRPVDGEHPLTHPAGRQVLRRVNQDGGLRPVAPPAMRSSA